LKLTKGKNGIDFASNIEKAKKSLAKVMNHRLEKLSTLLDANQSQLINPKNRKDISIQRENACSSTIKVKSLLMTESKRFKVNSSIMKHKCETCKKRFPSPSQLNIHKRVHSKQKPFAGNQCQITFSRKDNLSRHKRVHSGERQFNCDICPKTFTTSQNLVTHKRIHTGERPYSCDICQKKFTQSNDLTRHIRTHTGEKPYEFGSCHMKFGDLSYFIRHKRKHT
jgi:uncharacterized Zn-finger protein